MKSLRAKLPNSLPTSAHHQKSDELNAIYASTVTIEGAIDRILFQNNENGYIVFILAMNKGHECSVRAYSAALHAGQQVIVQGNWVMHPKFGKQFEASRCSVQQPTGIEGIKKYLASGLIKGIGPVYAERLVAFFGTEVLKIIEHEPHRLTKVPGIGQKRIDRIVAAWHDQKEISHIMVFLQDKGISTTLATKIYKKYRADAIAIMTENPYRLSEDVWGVGFKTADAIAQKLSIAPDSIQRIRAGILHVISSIITQGHLYILLDALKKSTIELLTLNDSHAPLIKNALHALYNSDKIKLITHHDQHYVTLSSYYASEKGAASLLKTLITYPSKLAVDTTALYATLRTQQGPISLNDDQQRGILSCFTHKITVITGGPGTGKTTLIKQLVTLLDHHRLRYKLAAPTGRAAKRMHQSTGHAALTIHRLLEFDPSSMGFTRNSDHALDVDFLIIDEASMIDIFLAHALLKALPLPAHLVFIGDSDQLPSVGPGNVLHDLIESGAIPTVALKHIFRQAQDSLIVINAHRINNGEFPTLSLPDAKKDFFFIKEEDPLALPTHFKKIYEQFLPAAHIARADSMVLVPMNRGSAGTQKLNHDLQALLNPISNQPTITYGSYTYAVGDRVMQIKNNYDKFIFNGDIGTIETIDMEDRTLSIRFLDIAVEYEYSELDELVLAYTISIHKSQGSEYDAAIIPLFTQHFTLLQRNLVYTAITRAKKLCIIIGQPKAMFIALGNTKGSERVTFLPHFLTTDLSAR